MKKIGNFKLQAFIVCAFLLTGHSFATQAAAQVEASYLIDLNSKTASRLEGRASAINDVGQVVGEFGGRAFITGPDGLGMRDLGTLGGPNSSAADVNNAGQVVGSSSTSAGETHAFITDPRGVGMRDLGGLDTPASGGYSASASAINDAGQVVGTFSSNFSGTRAFITGPEGMGMRDLGMLTSFPFSFAYGINDVGQAVGSSVTATGDLRAFTTGPDGMGMREVTLDVLPPNYQGLTSEAHDINNAGQVVGNATIHWMTGPSALGAFITGPDGMEFRYLGNLGGDFADANGINDEGQVVGRSNTAEGPSHAFITGADGTGMVDLNTLVDLPEGVVLTNAVDINNAGQLIAVGVIPEPETYAMLLAGLGLIGFMTRRQRRKMNRVL